MPSAQPPLPPPGGDPQAEHREDGVRLGWCGGAWGIDPCGPGCFLCYFFMILVAKFSDNM
jgi:hypothetical protein